MTKPRVADNKPIATELKAGQEYYWCACGRSATQPFCDGSHKGTDFTPVKFEISEKRTAWLCGCKHTQDAPFCDGSHNKL